MPDYRWGIFLADPVADRTIGFGDDFGKPVWQQVPGEHRNTLRRLIVTQGDTEPASVEQQRMLGHSCPSVYDLRNLFQVNVEEGRHLWAMVYLLHSYFGRDGREEAEALLQRRSGNPDKPRILGAFNEPCTDWLSFFMFTFFTDRDGKFQLLALAESGFDPLSRTTRFMLTEEAHHMFVGETGVLRVVDRTAKLMAENKNEHADDVRKLGGHRPADDAEVPEPLVLAVARPLRRRGELQRRQLLRVGPQGPRQGGAVRGSHGARRARTRWTSPKDGRIEREEVPMRNAMNEVLRDAYVEDCQRGVDKWNRAIAAHGVTHQLRLPSRRFHRHVGIYAGLYLDPDGNLLTKEQWEAAAEEWLPSDADRAYVRSLMTKPIYDPKQMANWISPPKQGIKGRADRLRVRSPQKREEPRHTRQRRGRRPRSRPSRWGAIHHGESDQAIESEPEPEPVDRARRRHRSRRLTRPSGRPVECGVRSRTLDVDRLGLKNLSSRGAHVVQALPERTMRRLDDETHARILSIVLNVAEGAG